MSTTKTKFSPSINIVRDNDFDFNYIVTPNSAAVFNDIFSNALAGNKCHLIIGAYGTGKSSLLLATKQTLLNNKKHFKGFDTLLKQLPSYEFISVVGDYSSITAHFAEIVGLNKDCSTSDIFKALDKNHKQLQKKGKGLAVLIDEFGKFLEYASKHNPEAELYFIQQLAEWINDSKTETVLIATLHQDFNTYALSLRQNQQQEWDKVKGRWNEIVFNEPVEQLLFLAAERIDQKFRNKTTNKSFQTLFELIKLAKAFPLKSDPDIEFAKKLYPFDVLSAAILTKSLQVYGQNERSLFSFIESNDYYGINDARLDTIYNIANVYDYLINNFYSTLNSKYNKHHSKWTAIRNTLEKVEVNLKEDLVSDASNIVKTIGLLNIFSSEAAQLDLSFYTAYSKMALGINRPEDVIKQLEKHKLIRFQKYNSRYIISESTDLDIEVAIDDAGRLIERTTNFLENLNQFFDFPYISAKAAYYEKGTPRFFQFKLTDEPINLVPEGEVDGFINLVFTDDSKTLRKIEEHSKNCGEAILFGWYRNTATVQNTLFEIQKVKKVINANSSDKTAIKALKDIESHYVKLLNHYVLDSLYSNDGNIVWFYNGRKQAVKNQQAFNKLLSRICNEVYESTPEFVNEMVNKTKVSGQISTARLRLIEKLLSNIDQENIGFEEKEFPPEKSIYLTLLRKTQIHSNRTGFWEWNEPTDESFKDLWKAGTEFLNKTKQKERSLQEFIDILSSKPFKLKQGFIDFWLPIFLLAKSDEFALFENDIYIPQIGKSNLELLSKKPGLFKIKAFDIVNVRLHLFNRYRILLNQAESQKPTNKVFIQTIKPFLVFYRDLPEYAKRTGGLNKKTLALRNVIANAKDPEKTFFEDFPTALGFSLTELQSNPEMAEHFINQMQDAIRELRSCYDGLIDRFEKLLINDVLGLTDTFPDYKASIKERFRYIKAHLLLNKQKAFYEKLMSPLDDRKAWLNSVAQSSIGKPLVSITDSEVLLLEERIKELIYELDNLSDISKTKIDEDKEDVLKVEITSFVQGLKKNLLRVPKKQTKEVETKVKELKSSLGKDKRLNITILAKLLQEFLKDE